MNILLTEHEDFSSKAFATLEEVGQVKKLGELSHHALATCIGEVDTLFVRLGIKLDKCLLEKGHSLKHILTATTGLDHIDLEYCQSNNIKIFSLKGETEFLNDVPSTAEHTWGLVLSLLRRIPEACAHVNQEMWDRQQLRGNNLRGKTLGIIGLGRVGKQVAGYGNCFGCKVIAYDPFVKAQLPGVSMLSSLKELVSKADIISIHVPLEESTRNLITAGVLKHAKKSAFFINTSRGEIWDEYAVARLLEKKQVAGVATDVISNEQNNDRHEENPLLRLINKDLPLIITPHIAGATFESMAMTEEFVVSKFISYLNIQKK